MYVNPKIAAKHYHVTSQCLQKWANQGKIKHIVTKGGHRRYLLEDKLETPSKKFIYTRVSSKKQLSDLNRQIEFLKELYPDHELIKDIGSGINFKRPGFKRILEALFQGNIQEVVVAQKDRFTRFGYDLFEWIFQKHGAKLLSHSQRQEPNFQQELTDDLMSIITVFTARYYGRRKYKQ